jgi:hypothetical protein
MIEVVGLKGAAHLVRSLSLPPHSPFTSYELWALTPRSLPFVDRLQGMIKAKQTLLSGGPIKLAQGREVRAPLLSLTSLCLEIQRVCLCVSCVR